ncbi:MAG TPA: xanthine dehydrogenase family protein molybdopterin-binding subunit [Candidatus Dormibacteraeota bacterium]|nr:xanthine dehydrogenase family protein molybdopterin-binding subunit [Candidatus Dormibacteraeota bacterium]
MQGSILGNAVKRREDPRLITGAGLYVADVKVARALHAQFVRSPLAHARISSVDATTAHSMPGVAAVYLAADLGLAPLPGFPPLGSDFNKPPLAEGVVRFVGEPIALVVAETREQAVDAAAAVEVDLEPIPHVIDPEKALQEGAPLLFPDHGSNLAFSNAFGADEDALEGAEVVIRGRFVNQRVAPVPLETHATLAEPSADGLKIWASSQQVFSVRDTVAGALGLEESQVQVVSNDVGGGFGAKAGCQFETVAVAAAARKLGRPVGWMETRSENMVAMTHGRAQVQEVELGATREGRLIGLRARVVGDAGAYPAIGAFLPLLTGMMSSGVYAIPRIDYAARSAATNTTTVAAYRGAGRPEAAAMLERAMDMLAMELKMDPVELRRRNLIPPDAFPYRTKAGYTYDSGDYRKALDEAVRLAGYDELRREQARRREAGDPRLLGIGVSTYVEITAVGATSEWGSVEVEPDGKVIVLCGTTNYGQGHETSLAQVAAEELQVPFDSVRVVESDTFAVKRGDGSVGSRSMQLGGSAVHGAAGAVRAKAMRIAAHLLEVSHEDLELRDGRFQVVGVPGSGVGWLDVAGAAADPSKLPGDIETGLKEDLDFTQDDATFPFGAHICTVEVDAETGATKVLKLVAVDDCGRIINPLLAEGQVHGGIAQGLAQAMFEEIVYDADGNPVTASLLDYAAPMATEMPEIVTAHTVTPSPLNPLGAKGIGESGTIGSTPAVQNAVIDAVSHLGVRHIDMPLTSERVWQAIQAAKL